jgi:uncharacterized protein (DUF433 family)
MSNHGAYTAERASALSGVPKSTIHWWDRRGVLEPSVSPKTLKLWSFEDLVALRVIYWLRQKKTSQLGHEIPSTSLSTIQTALAELRTLKLPVQTDEGWSIFVTPDGHTYINAPEGPRTPDGQFRLPNLLDAIAPFSTAEGPKGPDLVRPRPQLRIVPGRLSGSPHIEDTRVETRAVAALARDGASNHRILTLYPFLTMEKIGQAVDLEDQLADNLTRQVA